MMVNTCCDNWLKWQANVAINLELCLKNLPTETKIIYVQWCRAWAIMLSKDSMQKIIWTTNQTGWDLNSFSKLVTIRVAVKVF
jgi:hypothetical protein